MKTPKISVIMPVYKTEKELAKSIESVIGQTYQNLEIILIDDGSPDLSGKICDEFATQDSRIKVIHKSNEGVSRARNDGLDIITGEFVAFVDSDDTIEKNMLEILYKNMIDCDADVSICNFKLLYDNGDEKDYGGRGTIKIFNSQEAIAEALIGKNFAGQLCNKLFKASLFENLRLDEKIYVYEDLHAVVRIFVKSKKIVYHPIPLYHYYMRSTSSTHVKFSERHLTAHYACLDILEILRKHGFYDLLKYAYASILRCNIFLLGKLCYDKSSRKEYAKMIKSNIKKYSTKESMELISKAERLKIKIIKISVKMYFFIWKLFKKHNK